MRTNYKHKKILLNQALELLDKMEAIEKKMDNAVNDSEWCDLEIEFNKVTDEFKADLKEVMMGLL
ncbi:hypothetical protein M0Q97_04790 [Candidatus Dojkabacteria bacterium]|jgi:hypothetical protein|nr:hypothetical protein [Candidatus Dojkabacteria bacterium]